MVYKNELYHHGVLGMKWGVRKNKSKTKKQKTKTKTKTPTRFQLDDYSDDDLRNRTNRLNLESNYIEAKNRRASLYAPGVKKTSQYLNAFGSKAIGAVSTAVIAIGSAYLSSKFNITVPKK